jgi:N-acetylmuramoyl-L-alanine amidase
MVATLKRYIFVFLALLLSIWIQGARAAVQVDYGGQRSPSSLGSTNIDGQEYVALDDLAQILGAGQFWRAETKKMVIVIGGHKVKVTAHNPVVIIDDKRCQMPVNAQYGGGGLLVPLEYFIPMIGEILPEDLTWSESDGTLKVTLSEQRIRGVDISPKTNGTLVSIVLSTPLEFELSTSRPNWLHLSIFGGTILPSEINSLEKIGQVQEVRAYQFPDCAQISFKLSNDAISYKADRRMDPHRILISLRIESSDGWSPSDGLIRARGFEEDRIRNPVDVVVIDPGHGGKDPGAVGATGLREKDVVLDIGQRLAQLLSTRLGLKVIFTREDDTFIPLSERTKMANAQGADLFLSIHANASKKRQANGFETYFLAEAKNDAGRAAAILENSALKFERPEASLVGTSDLDFILYDMIQNEFHQESEHLADIIQGQLDEKLHTANRRVNQAPFYVLNGAYMPAVLVETAFISNPDEESLLKKRWFRQKIAEALYESVRAFKEKYERL